MLLAIQQQPLWLQRTVAQRVDRLYYQIAQRQISVDISAVESVVPTWLSAALQRLHAVDTAADCQPEVLLVIDPAIQSWSEKRQYDDAGRQVLVLPADVAVWSATDKRQLWQWLQMALS